MAAKCVPLAILFGLVLIGCSVPTGNSVPMGDLLLSEEERQVSNAWTFGIEAPWKPMVHPTEDGHYIVAGGSSGASTGDFVFKNDSYGNTIWSASFDGAIKICSMQATSDGGCVLGTSQGSPSMPSLMKFDEIGAPVWTQHYSILGGARGVVADVFQASDGGYGIAGWVRDLSGKRLACITRTDEGGAAIWIKTVTVGWSFMSSTAEKIVKTDSGDYVIAGTSEISEFFPRFACSWLIKLGSDGHEMWRKTFEISERATDVPVGLFHTADGGFLVASKVSHLVSGWEGIPFTASVDFHLRRTNSAGVLLWDRQCDVPPVAVCQASDGGFLLVGNESGHHASGMSTIRVVKANGDGQAVWVESLWIDGCNLWASAVQTTTDGGYVVVGAIAAIGSTGYTHLCMVRMDAVGNPL